jgi:NADH-quinone oxidoreductase subunit N
MLLMVSATDLMALYMGLELQSLSLYVIAAFRRDSIRSTEAGLKYFVLGALSSGLLLYGASLVYGSTGTTNFYMIATSVENHGMSLGLIAGLAFLIVGVSFKISVVPFHMWTPDVYEGSPTPVTAFFATAPKIAAMAMLVRLLYDSFGGAVSDWQQILIFLSVSSMFVGSIAAIGQQNIKRLMAYSSISHMGFALIGLASGTVQGLSSLLIYMVIYVVANIGTFVFILNMEKDGNPVTNLASLNMYSKVDSRRSILIATLMLSLAGLPPFVGFIGKLYIFQAAVDANLVWLAVSGGIASVIGAFYYLRIVYLIYFGEVTEQLDGKMPMLHWFVLTVSALAMVFGTINIFGLEEIVKLVSSNLIA